MTPRKEHWCHCRIRSHGLFWRTYGLLCGYCGQLVARHSAHARRGRREDGPGDVA